jgi:hypothetical protein
MFRECVTGRLGLLDVAFLGLFDVAFLSDSDDGN